MYFETGHLYHIYNRGNNSQKIFYNRENYFFFLKKIKQYILPYADIVAWVLMPNHFHIMVHVNAVKLAIKDDIDGFTHSLTLSETMSKTQSETISKNKKPPRLRSFNDSIGIMLRTYAWAIQKQQKIEGSLFQQHTKGSCLTYPDENNFSWFYEDYELQDCEVLTRDDYPTVCFLYIHDNPVKACLCRSSAEWEFSSAADYFTGRKGKLINKERAREYYLY